jgi:hypothetical protein
MVAGIDGGMLVREFRTEKGHRIQLFKRMAPQREVGGISTTTYWEARVDGTPCLDLLYTLGGDADIPDTWERNARTNAEVMGL